MNHELQRQIARIGLGDHLCLMYESPDDVLPTAAEFLRDGLEQGGHAIYVIDDHSMEQVVSALEEVGIDVERERARDSLRFLTAREYCAPGAFDPQRMLERFRALGDEVAARGVPFVRAAVEMTWALSSGVPLDLLAEYECWGNNIFEHVSGTSLCMYNRRRFPADAMERLLRAHPVVVLADEVAPNPFYEPPEVYFGSESDPALRFEWMVEQLHRARADRREREELAAQARAFEAEQKARAAAEEVSRAKSRFLAVMSHEFRTPLNSIMGYAELLRKELAGPLTATQRDHLDRMGGSMKHLLGLIDEVLDLSRVEAGQVELRPQRVDVAALARDVIGAMEPQARQDGLELIARIPDQPVLMRTDPGRVRQILLNLLSNAIKFTDDGRVTLTVEPDNDDVRFHVSDTGIGIERSEIERIFDSFHQAEGRLLNGSRGGAGLGLAVSRSFAVLMGGDVTVESEPGAGSTFTLWLPLGMEADLQTA